MEIKEVIILAGGLGTRLRSALADLPKCLAPVNGKPFIAYLVEYLHQQCIEKFIFSLGYKNEIIKEYLTSHYSILNIQYTIEEEPLGTGGAIKLACTKANAENVLIANGDTLFKIDVLKLSEFHLINKASCTLSLKPMTMFNRYGVVELNADDSIKSFKEKQFYKEGLINGGMYALNVDDFMKESLPQKFSFEKDYLEMSYQDKKMYGVVQDDYFIDIGIPEDYLRAQQEFKAILNTK